MRPHAAAIAVGIFLQVPVSQTATVVTIAQSDAQQSHLDAASTAISADGRFVAFVSYTPFAPADTDTHRDIYVFDRLDGRVTLESITAAESTNLGIGHPDLSGDGRFLVFELDGEIALRDRHKGTTALLGAGRDPSVSADGRVVVFTSHATNIAPGADANGDASDVYLVDIASGRAQRVSVDDRGVQPSLGSSFSPSVSADGRYVTFTSTADLEAGGGSRFTGAGRQHHKSGIYVHDTELGTTKPIAIVPRGRLPDGEAWGTAISADGRYVAFVSSASNLVSKDRNRSSDIFLADLQRGSIELVSRTPSLASGNGTSRAPAISSDGRFVVFQSLASDLICARECSAALEDINLLWDVFLFDTQTGRTARLSTDDAGGWMEPSIGPALDASGDLVAFSSRHPIDATDRMNDFDLFVVRR